MGAIRTGEGEKVGATNGGGGVGECEWGGVDKDWGVSRARGGETGKEWGRGISRGCDTSCCTGLRGGW